MFGRGRRGEQELSAFTYVDAKYVLESYRINIPTALKYEAPASARHAIVVDET
jgi:hypothetical protein